MNTIRFQLGIIPVCRLAPHFCKQQGHSQKKHNHSHQLLHKSELVTIVLNLKEKPQK